MTTLPAYSLVRNVDVEVDELSWPSKSAPGAIANLRGIRQVSLADALLKLGTLTVPPVPTGFNLSEHWAWVRYLPALDDSPELRLRKEWSSIDPHQKTILSDDFGVAFSVSVLHRALGWQDVASAAAFLHQHPGKLRASSAKKGPKKCPDYVAVTRAGAIDIVECKGTQRTRTELKKQVARGVEQKRSVRPRRGHRIRHALVGAVLIRTEPSRERSLVHVSDPEFDDFENLLERLDQESIARSVAAADIADSLTLAGFFSVASDLLEPSSPRTRTLSPESREAIARASTEPELLTKRIELPRFDNGRRVGRFRIDYSIPKVILQLIESNADNLSAAVDGLRSLRSLQESYEHSSADSAMYRTSLGVELRISLD
jgi:Holliday junction resolvase